jgi:hypothetical protein
MHIGGSSFSFAKKSKDYSYLPLMNQINYADKRNEVIYHSFF